MGRGSGDEDVELELLPPDVQFVDVTRQMLADATGASTTGLGAELARRLGVSQRADGS